MQRSLMFCIALPARACITAVMQRSKLAYCLYTLPRCERVPRRVWTKLATVLRIMQPASVLKAHMRSSRLACQGMECRLIVLRTRVPTRRDWGDNGCARQTHKSLNGNNFAIPPRTTKTATAKFTMRLYNCKLAPILNTSECSMPLSEAAA